MATKSPGIYYSEIDNTTYTNTSSVVDTTVAIVGYAKKGPIGEPTEISSTTEFRRIFGTPIAGMYSGLAVEKIISAGGRVLFTRVADTTSTATPSTTTISSAKVKENGSFVINRKSKFISGVDYDEPGSVFRGKIEDKTITVRTPMKGHLGLERLSSQLSKSFEGNNYCVEYKLEGDYIKNTSFRSFAVEKDGKERYVFVKVDGQDTSKGLVSSFCKNLSKAISDASELGKQSCYRKMYFKGYVNSSSEIEKAEGINNELNLQDAYAYIGGKNRFYICFQTNKGDNANLQIESVILEPTKDGVNIYLKDMAKQLNAQLSGKGIYVDWCVEKEGDNNYKYFLLFVKENGYLKLWPKIDNGSIDSNSFFTPFAKINGETMYTNNNFISSLEEPTITPYNFIFEQENIDVEGYTGPSYKPIDFKLTCEYIDETNSIAFSTEDENIKFKIKEAFYTNYLFETNVSGFIDKDEKYIAQCNESSVGNYFITSKRENPLEGYEVKLVNGNVTIIGKSTEPVVLENLENIEEFDPNCGNLITKAEAGKEGLFGVLIDEKEVPTTIIENYCYSKEGVSGTDLSVVDTITFISREFGEGTSGIGVSFTDETNPVDGKVTNTITVYNGSEKEVFTDVSFDTQEDRFFFDVINEKEENGGSKFIRIDYTKESNGTKLIVPVNKGIIYLGTPFGEGSTATIGNNGIVENEYDENELFCAAMDTKESGLSNKDLYTWHILIHPDCIRDPVQDAAIALCEFMEDGFTIVDPPDGSTKKQAIEWHNSRGFNTSYAASYWPWCKIYDNYINKYSWVMPSIVMAAQYCKVDDNYGPHYAPAGETNGLVNIVTDIAYYPNKNDRDEMYLGQNRLNPFIKLRNGDVVCYGEKTLLRKNSTLTKIHTRRMLIAIKKALQNTIKGYIFLPTMVENISSIRSTVTAIMEQYRANGGVSSYKVICDETNNTTETLQQDILNIAVSLVPTGCLEQIEIEFSIDKNA